MMRRAIPAATGAVLVVVLAGASPARAQEVVDPFEIQGWSGGAQLDPRKGTLGQCVVSSSYSGVTLSFALSPSNEFRIEIGSDDWHLRSGGDYVATLMIDHREPLQIIGAARSERLMAVEFGADDDIMRELRDGQFLRVLAEHVGFSFSLSGSSQALARLRSCVSEHRGPASASR